MTAQLLIFYLLAVVTVASAVMVVSARNSVHSVLFLILAFFNSAGLFILIGAEFLAMILVVVYVGAVAVLFMFVVMMLEVSTLYVREGMIRLLPVGLVVGLILLAELVLVGGTYVVAGAGGGGAPAPPLGAPQNPTLPAPRYPPLTFPPPPGRGGPLLARVRRLTPT